MSILDNLHKSRKQVAKQVVDLQGEVEERGDNWTSEEQEKFDRMTARITELDAEIKTEEERAAKISAYSQLLEEEQEEMDSSRAFGEKRKSAEDVEERYRKAFNRVLRLDPNREDFRAAIRELTAVGSEKRAFGTQVVGTSGYGGILVPTEFQADLLKGIRTFGGMGQAGSKEIITSRGGTLRWPIANDVANEAKYLNEASAASTSKRVDFLTFQLYDFKLTSGPIKISREMRQDGLLPIDEIVRDFMTERFRRKMEREWANSTGGTTDVSGLYACSTHAWKTGSTGLHFAAGSSNLTPELMVGLMHSVDEADRAVGYWMFNDDTAEGIRKLRWGSSGPFLWQPTFTDGQPDRILGKPYVVNNSMASTCFGIGSSNTYPVWFGNFNRGYWRRLVLPPTVTFLTERYADEDVVAAIGFARFDGRPMTSNIGDYPLSCLYTT